MPARTLVVMRHAKAEQGAASDKARDLTSRGRTDAHAAGRWLRRHEVLPQIAHVSAAVRTRSTWTAVRAGLGDAAATTQPWFSEELYDAGTDTAVEVLRTTPAECGTALLIGHNPTMETLVHLLDDGEGDPEAFAQLGHGFPTAALTVLGVDGRWGELGPRTATVLSHHVSRG